METSKTCGGHLADFDVNRLNRFLLLENIFHQRIFLMTRLGGARIQTLKPLKKLYLVYI